jgi:hypothetical protein
MTTRELHSLLTSHANLPLRLVLPHGDPVPVSFHITEVGRVHKSFVDCGGRHHETVTCQMQAWVGEDEEHRIPAGKLAAIMKKASTLLGDDDLPVEIEYQDRVISQYPVSAASVAAGAVVLHLETKHTDCLAKELCGVAPSGSEGADGAAEETTPCCASGGCCA